ncbi:hypothetical protein HYW44_04995 [Candidatus Daviesbacteria bacterium]|nr:hypothetical protein [Candidatus Daviesbacteria bacterium]
MSLNKLAELISEIFGPHLWMPILLVLLLLRTGLNSEQLSILLPGLIILLLVIPFTYLHLALKLGWVSKWDLPEKKERRPIIVIFIACSIVSLFLVKQFGTKMFLDLFILLLTIGFLASVITVFWKISIHMVLDTTGVLVANLLFDWQLWPLFILIPIVAWARLKLKRHTLPQLVAGVLLSVVIFSTGLKFFNL